MSTHYEDHKAILYRWIAGARAEYEGFCNCSCSIRPEHYSADPYLQRRFASGQADGKAKKIQDER